MNTPNTQYILAAITPVIEALEQIGVEYHIGGSVASSVHGILRGTFDADLVADLRLAQAHLLTQLLKISPLIS